MDRRKFNHTFLVGGLSGFVLNNSTLGKNNQQENFSLNYILPTCIFGYEEIENILAIAKSVDSIGIDIWPMIHGNQREQIDEMGLEKFKELLKKYNVQFKCLTQYRLGPFNLMDEIIFASKFGCEMIVTGSINANKVDNNNLKNEIKKFIEKLKPTLEFADIHNIKIAIENHSNSLVESYDSLMYFKEINDFENLGIALAPYHLPQDEEFLSNLILLLKSDIFLFYAWQHGTGSTFEQPKALELQQLPGKGSLDFIPILSALKEIKFGGFTEVFMHSYPRGSAMLSSLNEIIDEIMLSQNYLNDCISRI